MKENIQKKLIFKGYFIAGAVLLLNIINLLTVKSALLPVLYFPSWIPLALVCFPSAVSASTFLIAVAVWFPTTIMTSSGISNVQNSYFEVSSTLGANRFAQIFRVGVPAAMSHMFLGLFNGTSASFITLITAEMIGA